MKIYLVQHGDAVAKEVAPERPLSEQGQIDVQRIATALEGAGVCVDRVIHSGKLRAAQTADILVDKIASGLQSETSDLINPNDNPAAFDSQIDSWDSDTLVVGHLPFMQKLVAYLLTGSEEQALVNYRPGSVVCLEKSEQNHWQINWMLRPELLSHAD